MKKVVPVIMAVLMIVALFAGCANQAQTSEQASSQPTAAPAQATPKAAAQPSEQPAAEPVVIGVSMDELQNTFWVAAKKGMDKAAADLGIKLEYRTCEGDAVKQNAQIDELIAMGVKGIVTVYADRQAILQGVKAANTAKIPIVYCDRPIDTTDDAKPDWGITTDSYALTLNGWNWMVDYAKKNNIKLKVLEVVGSLNDNNVLLRSKAFAEIVKSNSDVVELVQQVPTDWDLEKCLAGTTNALQANPDINCIFMHYDGLVDPIASALKQANKWKKIGEDGHVMLMPYSGNESGIKAMQDQYAEMCFGMDITNCGYKAVEAAYKLSKGESVGDPVADPGYIITQENFATEGPKAYGYPQ